MIGSSCVDLVAYDRVTSGILWVIPQEYWVIEATSSLIQFVIFMERVSDEG